MNSYDKWRLNYDANRARNKLENKKTEPLKTCRHCGIAYTNEAQHESECNTKPYPELTYALSCNYKEANQDIENGCTNIPLNLLQYNGKSQAESNYNALLLPEGYKFIDRDFNKIKWKGGKFIKLF